MQVAWQSPESVLKWLDFMGWKTDRLSEIVGADQVLFLLQQAGPAPGLVGEYLEAATRGFLAAALHLRDWFAERGIYQEGSDAQLQGHYIFRRYVDWRGWVIPPGDDAPYWRQGIAPALRDCLEQARAGDNFGWDSVALAAHAGARQALQQLMEVPAAHLPAAVAAARAGLPKEFCDWVARIHNMRARWTEIGRATRWPSLWHAGTIQFGGARAGG